MITKWLGEQNIEIKCDICVQETHWEEECMREIERGWMAEVLVNTGDGKSRGVGILIRGMIENVKKLCR